MSLDLSKLTGQVEKMGSALATRQREYVDLLAAARAALARHAFVTEDLRRKIAVARREDTSWRGAEPVAARLDEKHIPVNPPQPATLIAADGSQIYPDRHGIAIYYLLNTGTIVLRQGSGQAPQTNSRPAIFFEEADLYDEAGRLHDPQHINDLRDRREIEALADLAEAERLAIGGETSAGAAGGDMGLRGRPIVALLDGPLLHWSPQRAGDREMSREVRRITRQLSRLRTAGVIPFGYIDRPTSANLLRTLDIADLSPAEITRERVRHGHFRRLADRQLYADLEPNQRSALFASTSEVNDSYAEDGHKILFFYLNVARRLGPANAIIARVELPEWAAREPDALDLAQQALYADCALTGFPYVLARAHELAVVRNEERAELERALGQALLRHGLLPAESVKASLKRLTGRGHRGGR